LQDIEFFRNILPLQAKHFSFLSLETGIFVFSSKFLFAISTRMGLFTCLLNHFLLLLLSLMIFSYLIPLLDSFEDVLRTLDLKIREMFESFDSLGFFLLRRVIEESSKASDGESKTVV
jgi:hypothetical protein